MRDRSDPTGMVTRDANIGLQEWLVVIGEYHFEGWRQGVDILTKDHSREREGTHGLYLSRQAKVSSCRAGGIGEIGRQFQLWTVRKICDKNSRTTGYLGKHRAKMKIGEDRVRVLKQMAGRYPGDILIVRMKVHKRRQIEVLEGVRGV